MATGDAALAAGMDVVNGGSTLAADLDTEINKTRDYIAERTDAVAPIAKGGTGANTAPAARVNLGVQATVDKVAAGTASNVADTIMMRNAEGKVSVSAPTGSENVANKAYVDAAAASAGAGKLDTSGGVVSGNLQVNGELRSPNATPATSAYTVAYINGPDGRVSKGASSERYKKFISAVDPASLGDIFPQLHRFQMRNGDGTWRYGNIAERLNENPDQRPFVIFDQEGLPESIDFIALLTAQNAQLHALVSDLSARVAALEGA